MSVLSNLQYLTITEETLANDRIGVQSTMQELERLAAKGELAEEELRALEEDVTGKIMLASWRGTRFEVIQVLREVRLSHF